MNSTSYATRAASESPFAAQAAIADGATTAGAATVDVTTVGAVGVPASASHGRGTSASCGKHPDGTSPRGIVHELYPGSAHIDPIRQPGSKRRGRLHNRGSELGMATAEYAIATLAAVGFAGILVVILRSEEVRGFLLNLIRTALSLP